LIQVVHWQVQGKSLFFFGNLHFEVQIEPKKPERLLANSLPKNISVILKPYLSV
jgi:hypothetical protein